MSEDEQVFWQEVFVAAFPMAASATQACDAADEALKRMRKATRECEQTGPDVKFVSDESDVITIFETSPYSLNKVLWDRRTGATRVTPDGVWMHPSG